MPLFWMALGLRGFDLRGMRGSFLNIAINWLNVQLWFGFIFDDFPVGKRMVYGVD